VSDGTGTGTGAGAGAGAGAVRGGAAGARSGDPAPLRRSRTWLDRRTAAVLAGAALVGVAGLVTLLVLWVGLVTATLGAGLGDGASDGAGDPAGACVAAATADEDAAAVASTLLPPRAVCTWTVDGRAETVVLAERPAGVATAAVVAAGVGAVVAAGTLAVWFRGRRRAADAAR
jgi:hypothetical protein